LKKKIVCNIFLSKNPAAILKFSNVNRFCFDDQNVLFFTEKNLGKTSLGNFSFQQLRWYEFPWEKSASNSINSKKSFFFENGNWDFKNKILLNSTNKNLFLVKQNCCFQRELEKYLVDIFVREPFQLMIRVNRFSVEHSSSKVEDKKHSRFSIN
jgi:hypothetical protein